MKKKLKQLFYHRSFPSWIFKMYFNAKRKKEEKILHAQMEATPNLLDLVEEGPRKHWQQRIDIVMSSDDNKKIPTVSNAGKLINGKLIMHNGLKINPLSYYNYPVLQMLKLNKGIHEPQEELIFHKVVEQLPRNKQLTMIELGAYWSFYSMWMKKVHPDARCIMVEPNKRNLYHGVENFRINGFKGEFLQGGIGKDVDKGENIITVDQICRDKKIDFIDVLHSDIQGFEADMLKGAKNMFENNRIGYVFISTHSNELHRDCREELISKYDFDLVAQADLDQSYSWDGVLVLKSKDYPGIVEVEIQKRKSN